MALTRVSGRVVYPHGEDTPTPVTGDGVIEYVHASPGVIGEAVHGPDRHRIEYVDGVAGEAWLKAGMWRAYVYPSEGRSYTLHLGIPEAGDVTLADVVGEVVPEGIVTRGKQGDPGRPGVSVVGGVDQGDGTVRFVLSDGTETDPVVLPPGPAGRGIVSVSDPDAESRVTITYTDGSTSTVQAIRGQDGRGIASISDPDAESRVTVTYTDGTTQQVQAIRGRDGRAPVIEWAGTALVVDGVAGPDLRGAPGAASTVPGPPGPPGAVPVASDYLVVGPGRPDAPTTTGLSVAQIAALPVGCEYRSTDGASVGAWVWRKRPTGWVVTDGDTGWVDVSALFGAALTAGTVEVKRTTTDVRYRIRAVTTSGYALAPEAPGYAVDGTGSQWQGGAQLTGSDAANTGAQFLVNRFTATRRVAIIAAQPAYGYPIMPAANQAWPTTLPRA